MTLQQKILSVATGLVLVVLSASFRDNTFFDRVATTLTRYTEEFPQEKVYLHLDKPYYTSGEIIWLKAYLVAGSHHEPSPFSRALYIDLFNQDKQLVFELNLKADQGFADGHIDLPDTLRSGNYILRAYTSWMRNFDHAFFYEREIKIWNPSETPQASTAAQASSLDLQFFPEGGNLVEGIRSRVGFKAVGSDGYGKKVNGVITDQHGNLITNFESNPLGMGSFEFVPEAGFTYFGKADEVSNPVTLPGAWKSGFVLNVTESKEQGHVLIRIQTNELTPDKNVTLVAQCRGVLEYILQPNLSNNFALIQVPKNKHLNGITQLTLFNGKNQPVAERLIYIAQDEQVTLEITPDKALYHPREKVTLNIKATDQDNHPVQGSFSLAIVDDRQIILNPHQEHITANLFLSSELKGYIENAGYYFNPENQDRNEALDALLLTQGWRRFVWQEVLSGTWPALHHPIEQGLSVSGKLVDILSKKPINNGKVTLLSNNPGLVFLETSSDTDGRFAFRHLEYYDSASIFLQGVNKRNKKTVIIEADVPIKPSFDRPVQPLTLQLVSYERNYLERSRQRQEIDASFNFDEKMIILDPVEVVSTRLEDQTFKIYGSGSRTIKTADIPNLESFRHPMQLIQNRVPGVQVIQTTPLDWTISVRGPTGSLAGNSPMIFLDNVQLTDTRFLNAVQPNTIESIEIFRGPEAAIFGSNGANGVIMFYTKRGSYSDIKRQGAVSLMNMGFQTHREFYSPRYDVNDAKHIKPDYRATIYWNPYIKTDSLGQATVDFFANDNQSTMTGLLEGLSYQGTPATGRFNFHVDKQ
ncbi:MAG: TonB-dependent receptor plug domain-containing protein [Cyclobacteriaceae bacterium]|jgi:hypothetical protein|nr:TonB-dependent receptor plug domain-containing protein [Cyclobacteriaceae bacterium]